MDRYRFEGHYDYSGAPNGRGELEAEVEVNEQGIFEGEILDKGSSNTPIQGISGKFVLEDGRRILRFTKYPRRSFLANLAYALTNQYSLDITGKYEGQWGALPYKLEFDKTSGLFSAEFDFSVASIGDYAELNVEKI